MDDSYLTSVSNLKGWYKNKFEIIDRYCTLLLEGVDKVTKNNIMSNILNEFLEGQKENISVKEIIGNDIEKYCYEKCDKIPKRYKYKDIFRILMYWALVLLIFEGSEILFNIEGNNLLSIKTNIHSFVVSFLFCSYIMIVYRNMDKNKGKLKILISTILLILLVIFTIKVTFKYNILIPVVLEVGISIIVILSYIICYRKSSISNLDYINVSVKNELKNAKIELHRINEKNKRKNKEQLDEYEYLDMKLKASLKSLRFCKIDLFLPIIFSIIPICFTFINNNIVDSLLYFIILLTIEYMIFIPVYSNSTKINKKLIKKYNYIKENNIPINRWE